MVLGFSSYTAVGSPASETGNEGGQPAKAPWTAGRPIEALRRVLGHRSPRWQG